MHNTETINLYQITKWQSIQALGHLSVLSQPLCPACCIFVFILANK